MPVRNAEPFLQECLDSISQQSYKNFELIAVNDHSTDNSHELLLNNGHCFTRLLVLNNKGLGIVDALNTAYEHINGQFITRMDADDIMPIEKLEWMLQALQNRGENHVATGLVKYFKEGDIGDGYLKYETWLNGLTMTSSNFNERYKECVIPSPCWMMYKKDFDKIGGFHSSTYPEDYDLAFRMYQGGMKVCGIPKICHYWRDHGQRASRNDDNYADNRFLDLKLQYFLKLDYAEDKELIVWGAGKKGKYLAKQLIAMDIPFRWICNNPKKIGKEIYGKTMDVVLRKDELHKRMQFIVAIANQESLGEIKKSLIGFESHFFA